MQPVQQFVPAAMVFAIALELRSSKCTPCSLSET